MLAECPDRFADDASIRRADLQLQRSFAAMAMGVCAAEGIGAQNIPEMMFAHQTAVAHKEAMRLMDRALSYEAGGGR